MILRNPTSLIILWILTCALSTPVSADPTDGELQLVNPYLLPDNHPVKEALDNIFQTAEPLLSPDHLKKAGFKNTRPGPVTGMSAPRHPKLKSYRIKTYFHTTPLHETRAWLRRIGGAAVIAASIERHGFQNWLKVPKKWIYQIPCIPGIENDPNLIPKHFILVVEEIKLVDAGANLYLYKTALHKDSIRALFTVIKENLLIDSIYPDNVPFSSDGKLAFIDTEHYNRRDIPIKFERLTPFIPNKYKPYWESLIRGETH